MYKDDLLQIFNLRGGGLAIYGGVIAAVITLTVYCKVKKQSFFSMADTGVLGLILGQAIGRWGNFFNAEAFGGYTDSLFALRYKLDIVGAGMLNDDVLSHAMEIDGEVFFIYLGGYGLGRMIIESLRTDSLLLPNTNIAVSQLLAGLCFVVSIVCITVGRKRVKNATK